MFLFCFLPFFPNFCETPNKKMQSNFFAIGLHMVNVTEKLEFHTFVKNSKSTKICSCKIDFAVYSEGIKLNCIRYYLPYYQFHSLHIQYFRSQSMKED